MSPASPRSLFLFAFLACVAIMGGALYLFLRGAHAPSRGLHAERPPRALIESLDRLFTRAKTTEAA